MTRSGQPCSAANAGYAGEKAVASSSVLQQQLAAMTRAKAALDRKCIDLQASVDTLADSQGRMWPHQESVRQPSGVCYALLRRIIADTNPFWLAVWRPGLVLGDQNICCKTLQCTGPMWVALSVLCLILLPAGQVQHSRGRVPAAA